MAYVLSIALPSAWREEALGAWLEDFTNGLAEVQATFRTTLIGGDTVATSGPLCVAITAFGAVETGRELRRSGARPGDIVFVSGTIGDGIIGLRELTGKHSRPLEPGLAALAVERYRRPTPRLALGRRLVGVANACADVSDGLVADLGHICEASGVAARIEAAHVPLSAAGRAVLESDPALMSALLTGGDDYELIFTASGEHAEAIGRAAAAAGVPVSAIGTTTVRENPDSPLVRVVKSDGEALDVGVGGWRHF
jgi:thiamine-monophosphate kinase